MSVTATASKRAPTVGQRARPLGLRWQADRGFEYDLSDLAWRQRELRSGQEGARSTRALLSITAARRAAIDVREERGLRHELAGRHSQGREGFRRAQATTGMATAVIIRCSLG